MAAIYAYRKPYAAVAARVVKLLVLRIVLQDLNKKLCPQTGQPCKDHSSNGSLNGAAKNGAAKNGASNGSSAHPTGLHLRYGGVHWYRPNSLQELSTILRKCVDDQVRMLFGNTSAGKSEKGKEQNERTSLYLKEKIVNRFHSLLFIIF